MRIVISDVAVALALAIDLHHLHNLRKHCFLCGGRIALRIEFTRALGIFLLHFKRSQTRLVYTFAASPTLDFFLFDLVLVNQLGFVLID